MTEAKKFEVGDVWFYELLADVEKLVAENKELKREVETLTTILKETFCKDRFCQFCGKFHEIEQAEILGMTIVTCPNVPDNQLIAIEGLTVRGKDE